VEFHLLYSGPLHSGGSEASRKEKHVIRKIFHTQLRYLWATHPNLRERAEGEGSISITRKDADELPREELFQRGVQEIGRNWNRNGFNFLPLVTESLCVRCSLDILFLRREHKNFILQDGDIDGRLKTLFDSLRMTRDRQELPPGALPEQNEDPFFCLLEDDSLISEVHIKTGPLLMLPGSAAIDKHDVYLEISVRLNQTRPVAYNWVFG
jgi:hypothetical protein